MKTITINTAAIQDWDTFHSTFSEALGFPDFYGRNMNAWIDCMGYVDDPDAGMVEQCVQPGEQLTLRLPDAENLRGRCPDIYAALIECSDFVNQRCADAGEPPVLILSLE